MRLTIKDLLLGNVLVLDTDAVLAASVVTQPAGRPGFPRGFGGQHPLALLRELDLTEDQREELRALVEQETSGVFERLMERRRVLEGAIESGADQATLRQLAYECGMAEADAAVERSRILAQMMEILTGEQQEECKARREEWRKEMKERMKRFQEHRSDLHGQPPGVF